MYRRLRDLGWSYCLLQAKRLFHITRFSLGCLPVLFWKYSEFIPAEYFSLLYLVHLENQLATFHKANTGVFFFSLFADFPQFLET